MHNINKTLLYVQKEALCYSTDSNPPNQIIVQKSGSIHVSN